MVPASRHSLRLIVCCSEGSPGVEFQLTNPHGLHSGAIFCMFIKWLDHEPVLLCIHRTHSIVLSMILHYHKHNLVDEFPVPLRNTGGLYIHGA